MSKVLIFIDDENVAAANLVQLQNATRLGLGEIRSAISSGKPIVEREIFDSNYDEHAALIRNVLAAVEDGEIKHRIYELPESETMETYDLADRCLVSIEVMRNILSRADAELDRQLNE